MNKFLLSGLLAVGALTASQQTADAWFNWKFSAGVNMQWASANNNWLWGALRDGPPPGEFGGGYGHGYNPGCVNGFPGGPGYGHDFPFFGAAPVAPGAAPAPPCRAACARRASTVLWVRQAWSAADRI